MTKTRRKATNRGGLLYDFPVLPFLSIMLGLMSVMALVTMGIASQRRAEQRQAQAVELVGIPHQFRPFHMRATAGTLDWLDESQQPQSIDMAPLIQSQGSFLPPQDIMLLVSYLNRRVDENRSLSFAGQQNTLILWVEPEGAQSAALLIELVSQFELPLRIGKLPILPGEEIQDHATLP